MPSEVLLMQSEGLGRGDDKLGAMLMANFLRRWENVKINRVLSSFGTVGFIWFVKIHPSWTT
jgi:hypothetical protein